MSATGCAEPAGSWFTKDVPCWNDAVSESVRNRKDSGSIERTCDSRSESRTLVVRGGSGLTPNPAPRWVVSGHASDL